MLQSQDMKIQLEKLRAYKSNKGKYSLCYYTSYLSNFKNKMLRISLSPFKRLCRNFFHLFPTFFQLISPCPHSFSSFFPYFPFFISLYFSHPRFLRVPGRVVVGVEPGGAGGQPGRRHAPLHRLPGQR